jgi:hypothetical protein
MKKQSPIVLLGRKKPAKCAFDQIQHFWDYLANFDGDGHASDATGVVGVGPKRPFEAACKIPSPPP